MTSFQTSLQELIPSSTSLRECIDDCVQFFVQGLANTDATSTTMLPSYVFNLPTGTEKGSYYAIDFGGTNIRILRAELLGNGSANVVSKSTRIPDSIKTGTGEALFDWVAERVEEFIQYLKDQQLSPYDHEGEIKMGFTFSFAIKQVAINKGILLAWGKGFTASGVVGEDVVELLKRSLAKKVTGFSNKVGVVTKPSFRDCLFVLLLW
jgi:hexokinase